MCLKRWIWNFGQVWKFSDILNKIFEYFQLNWRDPNFWTDLTYKPSPIEHQNAPFNLIAIPQPLLLPVKDYWCMKYVNHINILICILCVHLMFCTFLLSLMHCPTLALFFFLISLFALDHLFSKLFSSEKG